MTNTIDGSCHCGAVTFQLAIVLEDILPFRCNCSLCKRKGIIMAAVPTSIFKLITGSDQLSCYIWNTHVAEHYFCRTCGVYTHHKRRSDPNTYGINLGCIDAIGTFDFSDVKVGNGQALSLIDRNSDPEA